MNLNALSLREAQNLIAIMTMAVANGYTDIRAFSEFVNNYVEDRTKEELVRYKRSATADETELTRNYRRKAKRDQAKEREKKAEEYRSFPTCPSCNTGKLLPSRESTFEEMIMVCSNCRFSELWANGIRPVKYGEAPNAKRLERINEELQAEFQSLDSPPRGEV